MGQQHSFSGKGLGGIPALVTSSAADSNSSDNNHHPFSTNQNTGQDHTGTLSNNAASALSLASGPGGAGEQAQSVRAAIDSFIETCLAGSDEGLPVSKPVPGSRMSQNVEVITVLDEDESDVECTENSKTESKGGGDSGNNAGGKDKAGIKMSGEEKQTKEAAITDKATTDSIPETKPESISDSGVNIGEKIDKEASQPSLSSTSVKDQTSSDVKEVSSELASMPPGNASAASEKAVSDDGSGGSGGGYSKDGAGNPSAFLSRSDGSHIEGVVESMRLKTIIDRMLDNSLGGGETDFSSALSEQRPLPQIVSKEHGSSEGQATATNSQSADDKPRNGDGDKGGGSATDTSSARSSEQRHVEPMAVCFMEHIEKAVERSFSSITEEEERKEKEKAPPPTHPHPHSQPTPVFLFNSSDVGLQNSN